MKITSFAFNALLVAGSIVSLSVGTPGAIQAESGASELTCVDLPQGAISWWPGDDNPEDILFSNDGTLRNGAEFDTGRVGSAFHFDGINDFVKAPDHGMPLGADSRSLEFWMKPGFTARVPFWYGEHVPFDSFYIIFRDDGEQKYTCIGQALGGDIEVCGSTNVADDAWHHVAVTYDGTLASLYVDGSLDASIERAYATTSTGNVYIGAPIQSVESHYYSGLLDEITVYDTVLTVPQIQSIYNAGSAGKCKVIGGLITDLTASPKTARHGEPVDFTLTLQNPGTTDALGVQVTDPLPSGFDFREGSLSASSGTAAYAAGVITWDGDVTAGSAVTIQFGILVNPSIPPGTTVTNTADIHSGGKTFHSSASVFIDNFRVYLPCLNNACKPLYSDNFSNPASGWPIYDQGDYYSNYVNGEYRILIRDDYSWFAVTPGVSLEQNDAYSITVDIRSPTSDQAYATHGIILGIYPYFSQFYEFDIGPDGYYSIYLFNQGYWYKQAEGYSSAIHLGTATNHLRIDYHYNLLDVYVNGQLITQVYASGLYGRAGLMSFSYDKGGVDAYFDDFNIFHYTCQPGSVGESQIELSNPESWQGEGRR